GNEHALTLSFRRDGRVLRVVENSALVGNVYALAVGAPRSSFVEPEADTTEDEESAGGRLLAAVARDYVNAWSTDEERMAALLGVELIRPDPTEAWVSNEIAVVREFGIPVELEWRGVKIDADFRSATVVAVREGQTDLVDAFRTLSGLQGSYLEGAILESSFDVRSVSADVVLAEASASGQLLLTLTDATLEQDLPGLQAPAAVIEDIRARVARGQQVIVHPTPITIESWQGTGYVARDLVTQESAYLLSGQVIASGGVTVVAGSLWPDQEAADALRDIDGPPHVGPDEVTRLNLGEVEVLAPLLREAKLGDIVGPIFARVRLDTGSVFRGATLFVEADLGRSVCRESLDQIDALKSEIDAFVAAPGDPDRAAIAERFRFERVLSFQTPRTEPFGSFYCIADPLRVVQTARAREADGRPEVFSLANLRLRWRRTDGGAESVFPRPIQILGRELDSVARVAMSAIGNTPPGVPVDPSISTEVLDLYGNRFVSSPIELDATPVGIFFDPAAGVPQSGTPPGLTRIFTGLQGRATTGFLPQATGLHTIAAEGGTQQDSKQFTVAGTDAFDCIVRANYVPRAATGALGTFGFSGPAGRTAPFVLHTSVTRLDGSSVGGQRVRVRVRDGAGVDVAPALELDAPASSDIAFPSPAGTRAQIEVEVVPSDECGALRTVRPSPRPIFSGAVSLEVVRQLPGGALVSIGDGQTALTSDDAVVLSVASPADYGLPVSYTPQTGAIDAPRDPSSPFVNPENPSQLLTGPIEIPVSLAGTGPSHCTSTKSSSVCVQALII
ncbi:MAG: hypothetical protein AAF658_07715, partial [Myxococcota bacterium]